ncbi:MAG: BolA/IbaG family iron-sulfur metabolism protein [Bdellovibrionales bacterium]|nr:BolA/IbaG family iron-sulfur metabolism protein [Bdellovibrionales bacterium]
MWSKEKIQSVIQGALAGAQITVTDLTGTSDHFQVLIVTDEFEGLSSIQRHRKVYDILGSDVGGAIHALSLKTYTHQQWKKIHEEVQNHG